MCIWRKAFLPALSGKEVISVAAHTTYYEGSRPLLSSKEEEDILNIKDIQGKLRLTTRLLPSITIPEENTAAALEEMSRFAVDPHWLIYLPPTMSPCKTSSIDRYLEHPAEALEYYRKNGIDRVVCEKKHMGSRAVIILCRTSGAARERFGVRDGNRGIIYTRTGKRFFEDSSMETEVLARLDAMLTANGFLTDFGTDWICLDTEIMPWSEKTRKLLKSQYGAVGRAGRESLCAAVEAIHSAGQKTHLYHLQERFAVKKDAVDKYVEAYRRYCWNVHTPDDLRIAPFHLLACEGKVFSEEKHVWHMETLRKYCTGPDSIFMETEYITVDTSHPEELKKAVVWWRKLTENGGEGMVVKPETFTAFSGSALVQPAVKCRGREYLRIIYGPEYLMPEHIGRLKMRSLTRKQSLARKEFALGLEALKRFIVKEPLYRVHECVFAVLALESEPVDPTL